jgi:hypothetical protein
VDDHQITNLSKLEKEEDQKKSGPKIKKAFHIDGPVAKFG